MADSRLTKLADVLVNYSTAVRPGDWVVIGAEAMAAPLVREVYRAVLRAGGHATVQLYDDALAEILFKEASDAQLEWISPVEKLVIEQVDVRISIDAEVNTRALSGIDPAVMVKRQAPRRDLMRTFMERSAAGKLRWVVTQYPTQASAQEAEMSLSEYEDFVFGATFVNAADPVAEWRKIKEMQQHKVEWLKGKRQLTVRSANCDLSLSIEGRTFVNCFGDNNMPDGEIFTGPVEESVNGWVRFTFPAIYGGRSVEGVELRFENGKVISAKADKNEEFLLRQINLDPGACYLGEFAIGTNFGIQKFTGNILFDEKIGGTIHMALGAGYPETGSKNESALHWDMICDMRAGGEVFVDGDLFYKDGQFVV